MPSPITIDFVRQTLRRLLTANDECVRAEADANKALAERTADADAAYQRLSAELTQRGETERKSLLEDYETCRAAAVAELDAAQAYINKRFATATAEVTQLYDRDEAVAQKDYQEANWTLEAICDAGKKKARERLESIRRTLGDHRQSVQGVRAEVAALLEEWNQIPKAAPATTAVQVGNGDAARMVTERLETARAAVTSLRGLIAPKLLIGDRMLYIGLVAFIIVGAVVGLIAWQMGATFIIVFLAGLGGAAVFGGGATLLAKFLLSRRARDRVRAICEPFLKALAEAESLCKQGEESEEKACQENVASEKQTYKRELITAEKQQRERITTALRRRDEAGREAVAQHDKAAEQLERRRMETVGKIDADHDARTHSQETKHRQEMVQAESDYRAQRSRVQAQFDEAFAALQQTWSAAHAEITANLATIAEQNSQYFPDWNAPAWSQWHPSAVVPPAMRFGEFDVTLPAKPRDSRLPQPPAKVTLPALLPFPQRCSAVWHADGSGRAAAANALLATSLRFLTSLPPGKVRLTIIDPVGLGENFAALMHLADHDPQLVGARIWTEPMQIEKRLADTTAHMENVIQKYLRSQYASIEEYNEQAGEVAEPYRVIVVANFPANFTVEAARRLERIAASGASCGVYTLVSYDPALPLPQDFEIADLERASLNLRWDRDRFVWQDSDFAAWPLRLDTPPANDTFMAALSQVGQAAKDANRVEVDFTFIAPPTEKYWTSDSRGGIDVPLGRAGATKRQHLQLGKGTAQHALVAGKTGSGKSTLLHALITNLALHYGPDEIELYLMDFKKGVEFKTYATHKLPHARVIAVESEREFGLSVLQRLDTELKRRGDLFRKAGVQDIKGYREQSSPGETDGLSMPRIMLIVDEFQEFFVEDDRVAQEAALLLDRLVRQGRAFGLHVLLGSQTLGGAYSLARSTIDQMAVRIALQCSEADAGLILSKDNNAARLLSRPGEAIYNDANGLIEGNDIFQVCWLPDERREKYLASAAGLAAQRHFRPPAPPVVFEGNVPSDLAAQSRLKEMLDRPAAVIPPRELVCWLGDAMAIKEPTAAVFRRQSASNLLILGQQPEPARALFVAAAVATLAQTPQASDDVIPRVLILDGTPADDPHVGYFQQALGEMPGIRIVGVREVNDALTDLSAEFDRRQADPGVLAPPVLLCVYGMHRHKDLRKPDDDFGFGKSAGEPTPAQRFATLMREGPSSGIHTVAWCDTLLNLQRAVERAALREFEMKVIFQMSANDSSTLIDSPAASRLGVNRALFAHEELSTPEKFRPYSLAEMAWLEVVRKRLMARTVSTKNTPATTSVTA
jgi:DNA segregation ATPase FtsK/SpoIIIE, S-DNA-T family